VNHSFSDLECGDFGKFVFLYVYCRTSADSGGSSIERQRFIDDLRRFGSKGFKGNTRWNHIETTRTAEGRTKDSMAVKEAIEIPLSTGKLSSIVIVSCSASCAVLV
jgi:hypothetical protein